MQIHLKNRKLPFVEFFVISFLCFAVFTVQMLLSHGQIMNGFVFMSGNDSFMDFFNHIAYCNADGLPRVYYQTYDACFPPLAYLFYGFLGCLFPADQIVMFHGDSIKSYAMLYYVFYCVVLSAGFTMVINKILQGKKLTIPVIMTIFISYVFSFCVLERGNSAWLVCILLLAAIEMRQSEKLLSREMALILIAIAAGLKMYPAVFGLLYIAERRWKEAIRLVIYGLFFFFVPFLFCGGTAGIQQFFQNQTKLQNISDSTGNIQHIATLLREKTNSAVPWYPLLTAVFVIVSLLCFFLTKDIWRRCLILSGLMILVPKWSGSYTYIFLVIPLCLLLKNGQETTYHHISACLFAGAFSSLAYITIGKMSIYQLSLWALLILSIIESLRCLFHHQNLHLSANTKTGEK